MPDPETAINHDSAVVNLATEEELKAETTRISRERYHQELAEYEEWQYHKRRRIRLGVAGIVLGWIVTSVGKITILTNPDALLLVVLGLTLEIGGTVQVLKMKKQSTWFWFVGIFVVLFTDKNQRPVPTPPYTGDKPAGAVFSDW